MATSSISKTSVAFGVAYGLKIRGINRAERETRVREALLAVGLAHKKGRRAAELSSGETKRLGIARAMVINPAVLMLDEPTANIDPANQQMIVDLIRHTCREEGIALLMVTHSRQVASQFDRADRLVEINLVLKRVEVASATEAETPS